jgi:hypothetical protein
LRGEIKDNKSKTKTTSRGDAGHSQHNNKIALDRVSLNGWHTGQLNFGIVPRKLAE